MPFSPLPVSALKTGSEAALIVRDMEDAENDRKLKRRPRPVAANVEPAAESTDLRRGLIAGQEEERRRLARELHDGLNQMLSVLAIDVGQLAKRESTQPEIRERLQRIEQRVLSILAEAQRMSHQLHPTIVENLGLRASLESLCDEFSNSTSIRVQFEHLELPDSIPLDISFTLYRVTQEALRNVAKHAAATAVTVTLVGSGRRITLTVSDNGRGSSPEALGRKAGIGIHSMTERLRAVGGSLSVTGRRGKGVRVVAKVPLPSP